MSRNFLFSNCNLHKGDYLLSNNREWKAVFQTDGNFVIYGWKPVWASDTDRSDAFFLCMQEDCNLVMYNAAGVARWYTDTCRSGAKKCRLHLTDDGKLQLFRDGEEIWSSATSKGKK